MNDMPRQTDNGHEVPTHVQILSAIRHILLQSNHPFQTVATCVKFVDSLIEQSEVTGGMAKGCDSQRVEQ